ncbi:MULTISPECIES: heme o synthase [unclassified Neobacillus]|uniref:heme o synthase n=1 Tax=unclassified Neobacillus TaxID=2675272 RepID=UPI002559C75D|nr:heme o synthase [Neobacillus sp. MER 74]
MSNNEVPSLQKDGRSIIVNQRNLSSLMTDLKLLFKANVLTANVLPVFAGFWLALYFTDVPLSSNVDLLLLTIFGSTMVIAGALALNNWYDVDIDTVMDRTKNRPTVTGNFSLKQVLIIGISLTVVGFILLLFTTFEAALYGFVGWFTYCFPYTMWSKRKYTFNTIIGSVSGAVTPLIGWTAIAPGFQKVPMILFLILFIFQMPHTFAIAIKKYKEYKAAGVAMLPVVRGLSVTKRQMVMYIACLFPLPFFLDSLGTTFMVIAALLNAGWLVVSISGFFIKDNHKWAQVNFLYSVNYITIIFLMMIVVTLPIFHR